LFNEKAIISRWVADIYDQNETGTEDVEFLLSVIGPEPKRILEVACGSGRILVPLAKAGHTVTGIDADECMLAKIPAKAKGKGNCDCLANIEWRAADAVHDDWGAGYDTVVLAGNILYNIVSDMDYAQAQALFIHKAAAALKPGGCVYIDYQPGNCYPARPRKSPPKSRGERVVWEGTDSAGNFGRMILLDNAYDKKTRLSAFTRRFELTLPSGETIRQDIPCVKHFASLGQLHGWLAEAGLAVEREYGDYRRSPIGRKTCRAIILARKGAR